jgi:hypothetical protein
MILSSLLRFCRSQIITPKQTHQKLEPREQTRAYLVLDHAVFLRSVSKLGQRDRQFDISQTEFVTQAPSSRARRLFVKHHMPTT